MNDLIKISYEAENPTVSARELHEALEVKTEYRHWFPRMCEYGFTVGIDFNPLKNDRVQIEGGREVLREITDHEITIPMAKELCMLQRTPKGKEFRQYFISVEEQWNSPESVMARALKMADRRIEALQHSTFQLEQKIEADKPKVLFADSVSTAHTSILVGDLAKLICQNGYEIGQKRLFQWLRDKSFLIKRGESYNMPTQYSMELGLMEVKETTINNADGSVRITKTPKITGKGQVYFVNKFLGN